MAMFKTALVVVTKPLHQVRAQIPAYLSEINRLVSDSAYIHIQPEAATAANKLNFINVPYTTEIRNIIKELYTSSSHCCTSVNVRVLVGHFCNPDVKLKRYNFKEACDVVLIDRMLTSEDQLELVKHVSGSFSVKDTAQVQRIDAGHVADTDESKKRKVEEKEMSADADSLQQYGSVVVGGTFDRLHMGHKLLLSESCCLATDKLTVGVTDGDMNKKKTLLELIEPVTTRISDVQQFMQEVKPGLEYNVVAITDPYGPTITEPDMDLIVLSEETKKGGDAVNVERQKKGYSKLDQYVIELVEDACHSQYEETKISSSSQRKRLLGSLYRPVIKKSSLVHSPYIIGLTGGIASGKSSVCKRLEGLGAKIVDCDKLGHKAYVKGSQGFVKVVEAFGSQIVAEDGELNRKALGQIVFTNKSELEKLNHIVWPVIADMAVKEIDQYRQDGGEVVVLDAAVLLEAGWQAMCHEVWTAIVPRVEAVKRIMERNKLTELEAENRLASQISNTERVNQSNVILCTLWEYEYTQQQVEKAWQSLHGRKNIPTGNHSKSNI